MGLLHVLDTLRSDLFHTYYSASECASACDCRLEAGLCLQQSNSPVCRLLQHQQPKEVAACCTIQRGARGYLVRIRLRRILRAAVVIQRYWRGYLGRKRFNLFRTVKNTQLRQVLSLKTPSLVLGLSVVQGVDEQLFCLRHLLNAQSVAYRLTLMHMQPTFRDGFVGTTAESMFIAASEEGGMLKRPVKQLSVRSLELNLACDVS